VRRNRSRLDRVLRARRAAERLQRARLAGAEDLARRAEAIAQSCREDVNEAGDDLRGAQSAPRLDPAWIVVAQDALARMTAVEENLQAQAATSRGAAAVERATWRALRADVRGLERLEARGRDELREWMAVVEERAIEEFAARQAEERRQNGGQR